jgi:hypothetical protein
MGAARYFEGGAAANTVPRLVSAPEATSSLLWWSARVPCVAFDARVLDFAAREQKYRAGGVSNDEPSDLPADLFPRRNAAPVRDEP